MLELFGLMAAARWASTVEIHLSKLSDLSAMRGPDYADHFRGWRSPERFQLRYSAHRTPADHWRWVGGFEAPTLILGKAKLEALRHAFERIAAGLGDFCIHADDQCQHGIDAEKMSIWFW